jgi:hypothetical protein
VSKMLSGVVRIDRICLFSFKLMFFLFLSACLHGQLLDYGDYAGFGIGKGILGNDYRNPIPSCVTATQAKLPASHSNVRASVVYNADEYDQAFHIDQNAQASFLGIGGGSEELHLGLETGKSGSAFDIILEAYTERDSDTLNNIKWDSTYDEMIKSGDPQKIAFVRAACGDRFIATVFKEARLFIVVHVSAHQESSLSRFSGKASGSVNLDVASASASLGGDANIKSANQSRSACSRLLFSQAPPQD